MTTSSGSRGGCARSLGDVLSGFRPKRARTNQPVRRNSYNKGDREHRLWRPIDAGTVSARLRAAEHYDRQGKQPGARNGPLGCAGIQVLRYLYRIANKKTGQCDPAIETIARYIRRATHTVVRALAALKRHGFLDWIRRTEPTENDGAGPQVRQISNAYWFGLPRAAAIVVGCLTKVSGATRARQADAARRREAEAAMSLQELAATASDPGLVATLTRLAIGLDAIPPGGENAA